MRHRFAATWVGGVAGAAVVIIGTIALWPASEEEVQIEALSSTDFDEIRQAADRLGASGTGSKEVVDALRETRDRLVALMIDLGDRDLKQFAHLDFDRMMERISDRRQSSQARRLWRALGAVTGAIATLEPDSPEARTPEPEQWELPTREEWESRTEEATGESEALPLEEETASESAVELEGEERELEGEAPLEGESSPGIELDRVRDGAADLPAPGTGEADGAR